EVSLDRLADRRVLLRTFDAVRRDLDDGRGSRAGMDAFTRQALEMITSSKARDAFNVSKEPQAVRDRYGPATEFLQARRLVEAGGTTGGKRALPCWPAAACRWARWSAPPMPAARTPGASRTRRRTCWRPCTMCWASTRRPRCPTTRAGRSISSTTATGWRRWCETAGWH